MFGDLKGVVIHIGPPPRIEAPGCCLLALRAAGGFNRKGPIDIVVDSTGLKVFEEGEWKTRRYGVSKRRTWRKLHLAIKPMTQEIEAEVLTKNSSHDADQVDDLLDFGLVSCRQYEFDTSCLPEPLVFC